MISRKKYAFEDRLVMIPLDALVPTRKLSKTVFRTSKYKSILASIREVGVIEPLAVFPDKGKSPDTRYILLDGHLRLAALKTLGVAETACLLASDDEGFTYNRHISRLSAIQEHKMLLAAIGNGVPPERIAEALHVNIARIRNRQNMLEGIAPEVVDLLADKIVSPQVFGILRRMKPMQQIESVELMIAANTFTITYAKMLLATTKADQLLDPKRGQKLKGVATEDIARMEFEMDKLRREYRTVEDDLGQTMLLLVLAKGYFSKLFRNNAVDRFIRQHHAELAAELKGILQAIPSDAERVSA